MFEKVLESSNSNFRVSGTFLLIRNRVPHKLSTAYPQRKPTG